MSFEFDFNPAIQVNIIVGMMASKRTGAVSRIFHPCPTPGCRELTDGGCCAELALVASRVSLQLLDVSNSTLGRHTPWPAGFAKDSDCAEFQAHGGMKRKVDHAQLCSGVAV